MAKLKPSEIPYDPVNPPKNGIDGKPLSKNHFKRLAKHEAGHMLLNWLLGNRPCGAMLAADGEAYTMSERTDDSLIAIGLAKVAGFVAAGEKRHLHSLRANWDKPQKFAVENDSFWVATAAQHVLDELAPNLGWMFIEAAIRTVEEVCRTYRLELNGLAHILEKTGYIKYPEAEALFKTMDDKYKIACPDWVIDRCIDCVQLVADKECRRNSNPSKDDSKEDS